VLRRAYGRVPPQLKRRLCRRIPDWAWWRIQRRFGYDRAPVDAAPLERIAREPLERLRHPDVLTHDLLPAMGLSSHSAPGLFPVQLRGRVGRGVQSLQFPNQFGPYLAAMTLAGVRTYLEVGVERGGTFAITVEVLRRFGLEKAIAVDLERPAILDDWSRPEVVFARLDSRSDGFRELVREHAPIDLAFVDGDHSEEGVRNDFEVLRPHTRMLAFHDIAQTSGYPGVGRVWRSIREEHAADYDFAEYTAYYPELHLPRLGIGVAVRRDAAA
jgi:hypothetical protein